MPWFEFQVTEAAEHYIRAEVFSVTAWDGETGEPIRTNTPGCKTYEKVLGVMLKWDGCGHAYFGYEEETEAGAEAPAQDGYLHICGQHQWLLYGQMLRELFSALGALMPGFDGWEKWATHDYWGPLNARRADLVRRDLRADLSPEEKAELGRLERMADIYLEPFDLKPRTLEEFGFPEAGACP
jgi:hypothetical protein